MSDKKETLKDFLYDAFDYLIILAIIIVIGTIIAWRLDILFSNAKDETKATMQFEQKSKNSSSNKNTVKEKNLDDQIEHPNSKKNNKETNIVPVEIPQGSASTEIAEILKKEGLIEETNDFIDKIDEMKVETKLRSGYFEIPEDSNLKDIINIIIK